MLGREGVEALEDGVKIRGEVGSAGGGNWHFLGFL